MSNGLARVLLGVTGKNGPVATEPEPKDDREAIELANASMVAAALGLGIYIETLV